MKFAAATLALLMNLAVSMAVPTAEPAGMVQRLHPRSVSGETIFGRSFSCPANDPDTCCAVSSSNPTINLQPLLRLPTLAQWQRSYMEIH